MVSFKLGWRRRPALSGVTPATAPTVHVEPIAETLSVAPGAGFVKWVLFTTGFASMAMEVVWTRAFTPILKTQVYSFAMVVATYLAATFAGSWLYRRDLHRKRSVSVAVLLLLLGIAAYLPVLAGEACSHSEAGLGHRYQPQHCHAAGIHLPVLRDPGY